MKEGEREKEMFTFKERKRKTHTQVTQRKSYKLSSLREREGGREREREGTLIGILVSKLLCKG
jgi:hypothetical protein